jgi:hypothetical protein
MPSFSTRPGRAIVALAVVALSACVDTPNPTEVRVPRAPSLAVGGVILVTNASGAGVAGSIRQALNQATGGEIIRFDPTLAGAKIVLDTTLEVPKRVTIEAPADKGITLSGGGKAGVLHVHEGATLVNLTITEGNAQIIGGGILAEGALVLDHSTVAGNEAGSNAGIRGDTVTLINSTVTNNVARAAIGGGVTGGISYDFAGGLTMINSVVSHNAPSGIAPHGSSSNTPKVTFNNSIISNNGAQNCTGVIGFTYAGRNISNDDSCGGSALEMLVVDPLLGALSNNGGPTPTRALDRNSPAINATDCTTLTVDQRYVARDSKCDIGAFEFVFTTVTLTINAIAQVDPKTGTAVVTGTAKCSRDETFDLTVGVTQDQRAKRVPTVVQVSRTLPLVCGKTAQPWIVALTPPSGQALESGVAVAAAQTVNVANGVIAATASTEVRLAWSKNK